MENETSNRRRFFHRLLGLTAVSAFASLLQERIGLKPVKAATGGYLRLGMSNDADAQTTLDSTNSGGSCLRVSANAPTGSTYGLDGISSSTEGTGVHGFAGTVTGLTKGVHGEAWSESGIGVMGEVIATSGDTRGVYGKSSSTSGIGVQGWAAASIGETIGVYGRSDSPSGVGVMGDSADAGTVPLVARGCISQTANLQEWQFSNGIVSTPLSVISKDGWIGVGTSSPARSVHLKGDQACFRMDRNADSTAFILVRTSADFNTVWKTFYVGVDASGVNNGEFFIGDVGTNVTGPSTKRLWIDNSGMVHIPNLGSGDINFANGYKLTEDEESGMLLVNEDGEGIARFDHDGNLHIKGDVIKDL